MHGCVPRLCAEERWPILVSKGCVAAPLQLCFARNLTTQRAPEPAPAFLWIDVNLGTAQATNIGIAPRRQGSYVLSRGERVEVNPRVSGRRGRRHLEAQSRSD